MQSITINMSFLVREMATEHLLTVQIISLHAPTTRMLEFQSADQSVFYYSNLEWLSEYFEHINNSDIPVDGAFHGSFASQAYSISLEGAFHEQDEEQKENYIVAIWNTLLSESVLIGNWQLKDKMAVNEAGLAIVKAITLSIDGNDIEEYGDR